MKDGHKIGHSVFPPEVSENRESASKVLPAGGEEHPQGCMNRSKQGTREPKWTPKGMDLLNGKIELVQTTHGTAHRGGR
jgi:hypothetical protein